MMLTPTLFFNGSPSPSTSIAMSWVGVVKWRPTNSPWIVIRCPDHNFVMRCVVLLGQHTIVQGQDETTYPGYPSWQTQFLGMAFFQQVVVPFLTITGAKIKTKNSNKRSQFHPVLVCKPSLIDILRYCMIAASVIQHRKPIEQPQMPPVAPSSVRSSPCILDG